ncbi:hypothetical protein M5K25_017611 [Dendrobium thyrsiflorum]|uniref:GDSL esterase/lipase n=1 Tax=Dendrobium thyrsiflorum TaxID=117978 RepID=A0ABD0UUG4_DENTH
MASLFFFFFCQLLLGLGRSFVAGAGQVPAMFVFGDSLVDPGNNNQLLTMAKANFRPHGIDFPEGPTGRFCNGGTVVTKLQCNNTRTKSFEYTPEAFTNLLIQQFGRQLKDLYDLGARKFLIVNISPIGCIPSQLALQGSDKGACVESVNQMASVYNRKLKEMVDQYNELLKESTFLYWDVFSFAFNVIENYANYGFKNQNTACCGGGEWNGRVLCLPVFSPCQNRSEYVFWDPFHPTDAFNVIMSKEAYQGNLQASFPRNVQQLVES